MAATGQKGQGATYGVAPHPRYAIVSVMAAIRMMLSIGAVLLATGCDQQSENVVAGNDTEESATPPPRLPLTEPPMDRAALLAEVAKAASIASLGRDASREQRALDGKPFELRIRFGCPVRAAEQASSGRGPFNVRFHQEDRTLKVSARPDLTLDDPKIAARAGEGIESVEGFWMYRPWQLAAGCSAVPGAVQGSQDALPPTSEAAKAGDAAAPAPSGWRVGIAQFFSDADSRTRRRDQRAYEATKLIPAGEAPSAQGYDLVLSGRLRKLPQGSVISCVVDSKEAPPECVVSAEFDRVSIEQPTTGEVLAQWGS